LSSAANLTIVLSGSAKAVTVWGVIFLFCSSYWYQNAMSSVVYSALPSDHFSPWRSLMVHTFPSGLTLHDSSMRGCKFRLLSNQAHARSTTLLGPLMSDTPWNARRHVPPCLPTPSSPVSTAGFFGSRWSTAGSLPALTRSASIGASLYCDTGAAVGAGPAAVAVGRAGAAVPAAVGGAGVFGAEGR